MSSISPLQRKALPHYVFTFASEFLYIRIMETIASIYDGRKI